MTPESHGDESTSVMWNSAHVWQGKSSVKESTTHVRSSRYSALTVSCFYSVVSFCWDDKSETWCWDVYLFWYSFHTPWNCSLSFLLIKRQEVVLFPAFFPFDHGSIVTRVTLPWKKRQIIWLTVTQEWCFRTHPMGLWGVFISVGGRVHGHLRQSLAQRRARTLCHATWTETFFCHDGISQQPMKNFVFTTSIRLHAPLCSLVMHYCLYLW